MNKAKIEKINQVLANYFEKNNSVHEVRAKDMMDEFVKAGIFKADNEHAPGLPLRNLLRELDRTNQLNLIPYLYVKHNAINRNWFFRPFCNEEKTIVVNKDTLKVMEKDKTQNIDAKQGLAPWVGDNPLVLILGTFPGEKSLKSQAYYQDRAHNSFYKIMESLFYRTNGISDKDFLIEHHIALWDCMKDANREGSIDANITKYIPNEIEQFLFLHPSITTIILNGTGKTTDVFFEHFNVKELSRHFKIKSLSSTANTNSIPFEDKLREWMVVKNIIIGK